MLRQPAVAGYFYQGSQTALKDQVERFLVTNEQKIPALGVLSPHAGLVYSGSVAGAVFSRIIIPETIVLIGPNHTGLGAPVSLMASGTWSTPLGNVTIHETLAQSILRKSGRIKDDMLAHLREHSLEVQLPFLQMLKKDFRIVPIQIMDVRLETCGDVGKAVAASIMELRKGEGGSGTHDVLIVASSDMSHYVSADVARKKDRKAIDRILALDPEGLHHTVRNNDISMCGFGPAVAMLTACKILGASKAELIKYTNSGEVSGDTDQVVGYAGIVVS
ncbi:MAG: AmmeMemoRadiSam system protein B [Nitrospirota bacterium]|nr:AmmeMemoRadiSam system protein B [Nitrospirota bacterium]